MRSNSKPQSLHNAHMAHIHLNASCSYKKLEASGTGRVVVVGIRVADIYMKFCFASQTEYPNCPSFIDSMLTR